MPTNVREVLEKLGDLKAVDRELRAFKKDAQALSAHHPGMIKKYPNQWIAFYQGKVRAQARTFEAVLNLINKLDLPRDRVIIRFIEKNPPPMFL